MSDKDKGLPLLRKTPVDFLSREEARQALNPDVALDASEAAKALRSRPNSENILLAQHLSHASHGRPGGPGRPWESWEPRESRQPREPRLPWQSRLAR